MTPPPIRYPLPTMLAIAAAAVLTWQGAGVVRSIASAVTRRYEAMTRVEFPTEPSPDLADTPIPARGLLLRDETIATTVPDGPAAETIGKRRIVDLLNTWPLRGEPTHLRIGNDRPFGWVPAGALIRWDTRLVLRPNEASLPTAERPGGPATPLAITPGELLPIVAIDPATASIQVQIWAPSKAWSDPGRSGWVRLADLPPDTIEALLTRLEIVGLIEPARPDDSNDRDLAAILGRPSRDRDRDQATRTILRPVLDHEGPTSPREAKLALTRLNANWRADVAIGGVPFRGVPISLLPVD